MSSFCTAKATHIFFSKKFQHICVSLDVNFNESLTNDIISFEQLGPDYFVKGYQLYANSGDDLYIDPLSRRYKNVFNLNFNVKMANPSWEDEKPKLASVIVFCQQMIGHVV